MGILNFLPGQLLEIIEWTDDSRDTLSYRFPDDDKEIKRGAQLIVRESQTVQFVYLGEFGDTFGPGKHALTADNIPILTTLKSWKYGFESPFKADIYFLNTRVFTGNKWGTSNPVMMRDNDFGIVRARAFGTYDFRIVEPRLFLKEVAGTDHQFRLDEFAETDVLASLESGDLKGKKIGSTYRITRAAFPRAHDAGTVCHVRCTRSRRHASELAGPAALLQPDVQTCAPAGLVNYV